MTSAIDLGHMRLSSANTALSLALSNSARLSPLDATGRDTLAHSLFDPLASSSAWISRGTNLRLLLDITFQDDIASPGSTLELRNRLTTALLKTPLWHQLQLKPSLTVAPLDSTRPLDCIAVTLSHDFSTPTGQRTPPHRLGAGVPSLDTKPPDGIQQFNLEEVNLAMEISTSSSLPTLSDRSRDHDPGYGYRVGDSSIQNSESEMIDEASMIDFDLSTDDVDDQWVEESSPATLSTVNGRNIQSLASSTSPSTAWGRDAYPRPNSFRCPDIDGILNLIDAALRLSITDVPTKALSGIFISELSSFKRLEDFYPAVWSPGYLSNIASRAVFLPTISHAMSYMMRSTTRSNSLKAKLEAIAQLNLDTRRDSQHEEPSRRTTPAIQQVVSARVWQVMQTSLRAPPAGRKLKSLCQGLGVIPSTNLEAASPEVREDIGSTTIPNLSEATSIQTPFAGGPHEFNQLEHDVSWMEDFQISEDTIMDVPDEDFVLYDMGW